MSHLRAVIVDDERLARQKVRTMLARESGIEIVRECATGSDAVDAVRDEGPDLVFLDIQMPGMDGFGVLRALGPASVPAIVFITAHEKYAVKAFEVHAIDYLLKPFDRARFRTALERARVQIATGAHHDCAARIAEMIRGMQAPPHCDRIAVRSNGRLFFVRADDIAWIEAADNYARVHHRKGSHLVRETMTALEATLDPRRFVRIHRSAIVNIDYVEEVRTLFHGEQVVVLRGNVEVPCGRAYRERLEKAVARPA